MSTTPSPSQYAVNLENRNAKADGQASAAPPASSSSLNPTKTRKGTRKSRLRKEIKELNKTNKALWSTYITQKFQALYNHHLAKYRLNDAVVQNKKAKEKREMLRTLAGYKEALTAFRRDKEVFIQGLVALSRLEGGALAIDNQALAFLPKHE